MSSSSLTFLFNMPTDKNARHIASTIQFKSELEGFEVLLGKTAHVIKKMGASNIQEPSSRFDLSSDHDFPSLKKKKINDALAAASKVPTAVRIVTASPIGFTVTAQAFLSTKGKEILYEDDSMNVFAPLYSAFEIGSSSKSTLLTRSQRRNRRRTELRAQRAQAVKPASTKITSLLKIESMETSPHLEGSRFHPLSVTNEKESIHKIANKLPSLPRHQGEKRKKSEYLTQICFFFESIAQKENCSVVEILRRMGCVVSPQMKRHPLDECDSIRQPRRPTKRAKEVPPPRISAKLRLEDRIITDVATTRFNATKQKSDKLQSGARSSPSAGGKRLSTVASNLRTRGATSLSRIDVINETPCLRSSVLQGKVWRPYHHW